MEKKGASSFLFVFLNLLFLYHLLFTKKGGRFYDIRYRLELELSWATITREKEGILLLLLFLSLSTCIDFRQELTYSYFCIIYSLGLFNSTIWWYINDHRGSEQEQTNKRLLLISIWRRIVLKERERKKWYDNIKHEKEAK